MLIQKSEILRLNLKIQIKLTFGVLDRIWSKHLPKTNLKQFSADGECKRNFFTRMHNFI